MSVVDIFEKCAPFSSSVLIPTFDSKAFYNLKNRDFRDYEKSFNAFLHSLKKGKRLECHHDQKSFQQLKIKKRSEKKPP